MYRNVLWSVVALSMLFPSSALPADTAQRDQRVWDHEYQELTGQIARLKDWRGVPRERLAAETLDAQALTRSEDKDPLDIVLRRVGALVEHFGKDGTMDASVLEPFEHT